MQSPVINASWPCDSIWILTWPGVCPGLAPSEPQGKSGGEIYQVGKAMLEDRADRVVHDVVGIIGIGLAVPIFKFLFGDEITSIGKGRYPLAIH